jgi:hypothetical protein
MPLPAPRSCTRTDRAACAHRSCPARTDRAPRAPIAHHTRCALAQGGDDGISTDAFFNPNTSVGFIVFTNGDTYSGGRPYSDAMRAIETRIMATFDVTGGWLPPEAVPTSDGAHASPLTRPAYAGGRRERRRRRKAPCGLPSSSSGVGARPNVSEIGTQAYDSTGRAVSTFLGQRYALPPTGQLRFAPAVQAPFNVSALTRGHKGPRCMQPGHGGTRPTDVSEDCLFANIYTPSASFDGTQPRVPIMLWVHGGGWTAGSGNSYDGTALAARENIMLAAVNYRLGVRGAWRVRTSRTSRRRPRRLPCLPPPCRARGVPPVPPASVPPRH